jgi:hypothetical protein
MTGWGPLNTLARTCTCRDVRDLLREPHDQGCWVCRRAGSGHIRVRHESGAAVTVPSSPADPRSLLNTHAPTCAAASNGQPDENRPQAEAESRDVRYNGHMSGDTFTRYASGSADICLGCGSWSTKRRKRMLECDSCGVCYVIPGRLLVGARPVKPALRVRRRTRAA